MLADSIREYYVFLNELCDELWQPILNYYHLPNTHEGQINFVVMVQDARMSILEYVPYVLVADAYRLGAATEESIMVGRIVLNEIYSPYGNREIDDDDECWDGTYHNQK